jgi:hypothetical protein
MKGRKEFLKQTVSRGPCKEQVKETKSKLVLGRNLRPLLQDMWSDSKVRELIAVKVIHTSLLNSTVFAFKVLPLGSYAPMPAPSPPFKTILELVLWNGLRSCRLITHDVISVFKMPSFQYFLYLGDRKKSMGARSGEYGGCSSTVICLLAKNSHCHVGRSFGTIFVHTFLMSIS